MDAFYDAAWRLARRAGTDCVPTQVLRLATKFNLALIEDAAREWYHLKVIDLDENGMTLLFR